MNLKKILKQFYPIERIVFFIKFELPLLIKGDEKIIVQKFEKQMGFKPDLIHPKTMAEKIQWLKLYDRQEFNTLAADKLRVREFYKENFGEEYVVPLIKVYDSWKDITLDNLPNEAFVIKANTGTSTWQIVRNKSEIDIDNLRHKCRKWMFFNHYYVSQEWQYKNIKPCIIVERLLTDKNGKIPVDYKFHYIDGKLQFIYCVVDREGDSYRAMFSPEWKLLPFQWVSISNHKPLRSNIEEPKPHNLDKMIEFGNIIAKKYKYYVRVDYYEVDNKMYFGEITMHHGSGLNRFYPPQAELPYSKLLKINV